MFQKKPLNLSVVEPVTVQELAYNLRLIPTPSTACPEHEVVLLAKLITTARREAEEYTGKPWVEQAFQGSCPSFDGLTSESTITEVQSIEYYDTQNILTTLPTSAYYLSLGRVRFTKDLVFPPLYERPDAVVMTYKAGTTSVPPTVAHAITMLASHLYENREATSMTDVKDVPYGYRWLLDSHRAIIV